MIRYDKVILKTINGNRVSIPYDRVTSLPVLKVYNEYAEKRKELKGWVGSITDETNQNLSPMKKSLLRCHIRLGHLGMQHVQCLGRNDYLDAFGGKWGHSSLKLPMCSACFMGKQ